METVDAEAPSPPLPGRRWALFLDIDGTLLDLAPSPDEVAVPDGLAGTLHDLAAALGGAVAIVSGRAIATLDRLFGPLRLPVAGQHGAEIRFSSTEPTLIMSATDAMDGVRGPVAALVGSVRGARIEDKGLSLAVHYRGAPARGGYIARGLAAILDGGAGALEVVGGKMVLEVKPRAVDKATAVRRILGAPAFAGRVPVFVGDDLTDRDGFDATLSAGGYAVQVGGDAVRGRYWLRDPADVRGWLRAGAAALGGGAP